MATFLFNEGAYQLTKGGTIDWLADDLRIRIISSSVTVNRNSTVMTGYTGLGTDAVLANKTKTKDTTNNRIVYVADNPTCTGLTAGSTMAGAVIYKHVTNDADSIPIAYYAFSNTPSPTGNQILNFSNTGVILFQN